MVSVAYGNLGADSGVRMRARGIGYHPPTSHFQKCFGCRLYNFSIISNLFDSNKLHALSTHNQNMRTKCIIFGETLKIKVKKFKQNLPENY